MRGTCGAKAITLLLVGASLLTPGCSPAAPVERTWPPGTVVAVDDVPITLEEVDAEIEPFLVFEPRSTDDHARRLAFTHVLLPRTVARLRGAPGAYENAREQAAGIAAYVAVHGAPPPEAPGEFVAYGGPRQLGFATWLAGFELEPGEWSGALAAPFDFRVVRAIQREDGTKPEQLVLELAVLSFPFAPDDFSPGSPELHYPDHRLTIVDPAWRAIVPEWIQYAMHAHDAGSP